MNIKKNDEYIVDIIDSGLKGEGIAKIDGFTIFVPNVIKGEKVKIHIVKVLSSHGFGKAMEIIDKSDKRQKEDCITYKRCGGCTLRHMNYEETLRIKKSQVENAIRKQNLDNIKVNDIVRNGKSIFL